MEQSGGFQRQSVPAIMFKYILSPDRDDTCLVLESLCFAVLRLLLPLHEPGELSPRLLLFSCNGFPQRPRKGVVESRRKNVRELGDTQNLITVVATHFQPLRFVCAAQEVAMEGSSKSERGGAVCGMVLLARRRYNERDRRCPF